MKFSILLKKSMMSKFKNLFSEGLVTGGFNSIKNMMKTMGKASASGGLAAIEAGGIASKRAGGSSFKNIMDKIKTMRGGGGVFGVHPSAGPIASAGVGPGPGPSAGIGIGIGAGSGSGPSAGIGAGPGPSPISGIDPIDLPTLLNKGIY